MFAKVMPARTNVNVDPKVMLIPAKYMFRARSSPMVFGLRWLLTVLAWDPLLRPCR